MSKNSNKLVEKSKDSFTSRYKNSSSNVEMKKQVSSAYKSRYADSLSPENEIEVNQKTTFRPRY